MSSNAMANSEGNKTYEYYGIVNGNGEQCNVYLKVNDTWERYEVGYKVDSNYIGYECKVIVVDRMISIDNFKSVNVICIKDIDSVDCMNKVNECINEWNGFIVK
jgi:hypothetical protein